MYLSRRKLLTSLAALIATSNIYADKSFQKQHRKVLSGLACNMESWWTDFDFLKRFEKAAKAGFSAVEFWDYRKKSRDMNTVANLTQSLNLDIIQFTAWQGPSLANKKNHIAFSEAIKNAVKNAILLNAPMFTVVGHQKYGNMSQEESLANLSIALEKVIPILEDGRKMLILEPFNPIDHQGHFLNGSADALKICREINSPFIKINWDLYHMQLTEGNLIANLNDGIDQIGYIQIADVPGRHQPGTGELNYKFIFNAINKIDYRGPIGLECWPQNNDEEIAISDIIAARHI